MKKLLLTFGLLCFTMLTYSQEHMKFKGISMDCDIKTFISQLEAQGYTRLFADESGAVFSGNFAGEDDSTIYVVGTSDGQFVWKVAVIFPECQSWNSLKNKYETFKESYTNKYGTPSSYEFFSDPYYEGDGYELQALRLGKCTYASIYTTSEGNIAVTINEDKQVEVLYEDAINMEKRITERDNEILNDI